MHVKVWVTPEPMEVNVDVSDEDIANALMDVDPDSARWVDRVINSLVKTFRAIPDSVIAEWSASKRKVVRNFLLEQAERCEEHAAEGGV